MITPLDIQNKEFPKGVRGYKEEEVDMFLDLITLDLEKIIKENVKLKAEVTSLESEMEKYKGSEGEVVKVLEQAKQLMGDISVSAEKRAEILLKNAELDAELTMREAKDRAERLKDENKNLKKKYISFRDKYKKMLEEELNRFENLDEDMYPEDDGMDKLEELLGNTEIPERVEKAEEAKTEDIFGSNETGDGGEMDIDDRKTVVNLKVGDRA